MTAFRFYLIADESVLFYGNRLVNIDIWAIRMLTGPTNWRHGI